jgi:hypothetical protein
MSDFHHTNNISGFGFVPFIRLKNPTHLGSSDAVNLIIPCHRISPSASVQTALLLSLYVGSKVQQVYSSGAEREVGQFVGYKQVAVKMVKQIRWRQGTRSNTVCIRYRGGLVCENVQSDSQLGCID